jgi:hypothetical protein
MSPLVKILIIAAIIGGALFHSKPVFSQQLRGRCGDGICGEVEKARPNLCPADCRQTGQAFPSDNGKIRTFVMIHFEAGGDGKFSVFRDIVKKELNLGPAVINNTSLNYQRALWPTVIKLVALADKYEFKLTLALSPQWAEFILKDESRIDIFKAWGEHGHELAFHHHGIDHIDWDGYTNRFGEKNYNDDDKYLKKYKSGHRGTSDDGFKWLQELSSKMNPANKVVTGTITDTKVDTPAGITILTEGSLDLSKGMLAKPRKQTLPAGEIIWFRHAQLRSNFNEAGNDLYNAQQSHDKAKELLERFKEKFAQAKGGEVAGVVFHEFDFYRCPDIYEEWFKFVGSNGYKAQTLKEIAGYPQTGTPEPVSSVKTAQRSGVGP